MMVRLSVVAIAVIAVSAVIYNLSRSTVERGSLVIATVERGDIEPSVAASGIVAPAIEEMIICPISSQILEVLQHSGDAVEAGTPLLRLDTQNAQTEYRESIDRLQMQQSQLERLRISNRTALDDLAMKAKVAAMKLERLEAELRNEQYLDSLGSGTHDKVREAEFSCRTSRLELEQLRQQLENERRIRQADEQEKQLEINIASRTLDEIKRTLDEAQIRSPRRAIITYILDEVGAQVSQGSKIAVVSDLSHFKINGTVADIYADHVIPGSKVRVKIGSENLDGTVGNVTPLSRNGVISFTVVLREDNHKRLRSGLTTDLYIINSIKEDVLCLPNTSLYTGPGEYSLFVMEENDRLERRSVTLGECSYDKVEVIAGLEAGDRVVVSDMKKFKSTNSIKIN